jgi:SH3 domain-containing protein
VSEKSGFARGLGLGCGCLTALVLVPIFIVVVGIVSFGLFSPTKSNSEKQDLAQSYAQAKVNVREGPGLDRKVLFVLPEGESVRIEKEPSTGVGGHTWVKVTARDGRSGWCDQDLLTDKAPPPPPKFTKEQIAILESNVAWFQKNGVLRKYDHEMHEAYVEPAYWSAMSIDAKKGFAVTMAQYNEVKGGSGWIYVRDYRSGKKLAKFGVWGWASYE